MEFIQYGFRRFKPKRPARFWCRSCQLAYFHLVMLRTLTISLLVSLFSHAGEERRWSNSDGTKHFDAEFVSREADLITLLRSDGKELTFDISKLHEEDRQWLTLNHPPGGKQPEVKTDARSVFDTLNFGDDRTLVSKKLAASKMVETSVDGIFQGRTGLNGIYRTRGTIGGLYCYLFFDWSEAGTLREITLQTEAKSEDEYLTDLKPCWAELVDLISPIHGRPTQAGNIASSSLLSDGQILGSHLWNIEHGGTVMLGTSRDSSGYQVVVRFTQEKIAPVTTP